MSKQPLTPPEARELIIGMFANLLAKLVTSLIVAGLLCGLWNIGIAGLFNIQDVTFLRTFGIVCFIRVLKTLIC